ncbi:MAG: hypothetical protein AB7O88_14975 [Reyranellaceae bacterium]
MKPSEFYVGVVDVFSIFVPGIIFTVLVIGYWQPPSHSGLFHFIGSNEVARWGVVLVASYFFGHLIYGIGGWLDSPMYNLYRLKRWGKDGEHSAYVRVTRLRQLMLGGAEDLPVNNFKWAKSILLAKAPAGLAEVNRIEADSKFFRSLVVLCTLIGCMLLFAEGPIAGLAIERPGWVATAALLLAILSFNRYASLRYKSTQVAYSHVIIHLKLAAGK